jgi:glycosyltransferase involved in cell wall biosynthesis
MSTRLRPRPLISAPRVTVVVPHFNYGRYLPTAVASALEQPAVDVDVVIVDDASTDGSAVVARRLAREDSRITLIEHPVNRRHIATYNDGLEAASGDYVVLLSADDALSPGSLSRSTALLEANPGVGLVYGNARTFVDEPPISGPTVPSWRGARETWSVWEGEEWLGLVARRGRNVITNPEVVMRRDLLADIGGYDRRFPHSADLLLWLRAAARQDIGRVNGTVQGFYRVHGTNMHSTQFGGLLDDYSAVRDTFDAFFTEDADLLQDARRLRVRARRAIAQEALLRTALLPSIETAAAIDSLIAFAAESDPSARFARGAYSRSMRLGLKKPLELVENLRWRFRYHRELRWGT